MEFLILENEDEQQKVANYATSMIVYYLVISIHRLASIHIFGEWT